MKNRWVCLGILGIATLCNSLAGENSAANTASLPPLSSPNRGLAYVVGESPVWQDGKREWLHYEVTRPTPLGEVSGQALIITSKSPKSSRPDGQGPQPLLVSLSLQMTGDVGNQSAYSEWQWFSREERLLRQEAVLAKQPGGILHRQINLEEGTYKLRQLSYPEKEQAQSLKAPLITEELLFTWLREQKLMKGYTKEIWWLPTQLSDRKADQAVFARVFVSGSEMMINDSKAWRVFVSPNEGRKAEVQIQSGGDHLPLKIIWTDGSTFNLQVVERR